MNFYLILFLFVVLSVVGYKILLEIDSHIDYSRRGINYSFLRDDKGFYIKISYFIWQKNKKKFIEESFSDEINYEGKTYIITAVFKSQPHSNNKEDFLPGFMYRDYIATVDLKSIPENISTNINQIIGNNNTINNITTTTQQNISDILNNIELLLQTDINDIDKQCLELFKLKLYQNDITESDKNRVLSVLEKLTKYAPYASLASSIINLIKSLLP